MENLSPMSANSGGQNNLMLSNRTRNKKTGDFGNVVPRGSSQLMATEEDEMLLESANKLMSTSQEKEER